MKSRRDVLKLAAAAALPLAAPNIARAQGAKTLRFAPSADLALVDPVANTATITRNHGYLVFDTLYGLDDNYQVQPQMLAGHQAEDDHKTWTLTLRDGLRFHDNEPVLAKDVVASLRRWAKRDVFGAVLMERTDELSAISDKQIEFRLKKSFALLPDALGKIPPCMPCIMPERLAATDPFTQVSEVTGSGPFRFVQAERVSGAKVVYEKFAGYVPRASGTPQLTAGPKIAYLDRVEWVIMPDAGSAAGALQTGEIDWWEGPSPDLQPVLRKSKDIAIEIIDRTGLMPILRFNALHPPFDNVGVRRAVLRALDQTDMMSAYSDDKSTWRDHVGVFPPGTPMASNAGTDELFGPTNIERAKAELTAAGYKGERIAFMAAGDSIASGTFSPVVADLFKRIGLNVDYQQVDLGTLYQRRTSKQPPDKGGWSCFIIGFTGIDLASPAVSLLIRGNGEKGWYGWPTSPELERLHEAWFDAADLADAQSIGRSIQRQVWQDAPYVPLGQILQPTAYRKNLSGILGGFPKFYNVKKG